MNHDKFAPVYISRCENYNTELLKSKITEAFSLLGIGKSEIAGKNVLLKPNLVLAKKPEFAATTHPAFVRACAEIMEEMGAEQITIADSPGGPYNKASISAVYKVCELDALDGLYDNVSLYYDCSFGSVNLRGEKLKTINIINPVIDADVVIDLCKLKSHTLTGMSCAVKNLFGIIPGVEKFQVHSSFPDIKDFSDALVDIASYITENKTFIVLCDGILAMEGNGPTHGTPKNAGLVLASRSPFCLDVAAAHILGSDNEILHVSSAVRRGLAPDSAEGLTLCGESAIPVLNFRKPDSDAGRFLKNLGSLADGRLASMFEARPKINTKKCIGCGRCVSSCPRGTISLIKSRNGRNVASIDRSGCIKCYCCQELCPIGAVDTHRNFLIKLIH